MYKLTANGLIAKVVEDGTLFFPQDVSSPDYRAYLEYLEQGGEPAVLEPPSMDELKLRFTQAIQQRLDLFAQSRGYDSILSASTYADSSIPKFASEGQKAKELRDQTWVQASFILGQIEAGARPLPSSFQDIEPDLPLLTWD